MGPLIFFRALQGAGAGAIQPIATTIVGDIYTPAERARVQGYLSGVFGVAAVFGPPLGAFLVEHASWSFVFWINLPIGLASFAMLGWFLHDRRQTRAHQIDYVGSALLSLGAGALMLVMIQAQTLSARRKLGELGRRQQRGGAVDVVSIQASVDWGERGVATSSYMFMRIVGQSVGAAVFGAVLNFGIGRHGPEAGELVNRLLDPALRHTLGTAELARLSDAIASSLHLVYIIAALAAVVTLGLAFALPAALSPTRPRAHAHEHG